MHRDADGWHRSTVDDVAAGTAYRFRVDANDPVPDPASRSNPWDANGASAVVDPRAFEWNDDAWRGRPWHEAVVYELHIGTFTPDGTFDAAIERLDHLVDLGVRAVEVLPIAEFSGVRNGADVLLKTVFVALGGRSGLVVFGALLVGGGAWLVAQDRRRSGKMEPQVFALMLLESIGYALVFGLVTSTLHRSGVDPTKIEINVPTPEYEQNQVDHSSDIPDFASRRYAERSERRRVAVVASSWCCASAAALRPYSRLRRTSSR